jgi:probable HAF family extracellular repeat protein
MNTKAIYVCLTLCSAGVLAAKPTPRYQFVPLGTLPGGTVSTAISINDRNQVVGISGTRSAGYHAYLWEDGRMRDLGTGAGGTLPFVDDINDHGQIVGNIPGAYFGTRVLQGPDGYVIRSGRALNNSGTVVGVMYHEEPAAAAGFVYEDGVVRRLPAITPNGYSEAFGINNVGEIFGYAQAGPNQNPVIWSKGQIIDLTEVPGVPFVQVADINDRGHVCGASAVEDPGPDGGSAAPVFHASLYRDNFAHDLGALPNAVFSAASGINNSDEVIGISQNEAPEDAVPFIYTGGELHSAEELTVGTRGWKLIRLTDINNQGWIIGFAFKDQLRQAFILRPIGGR